jgi:hypothetical protein
MKAVTQWFDCFVDGKPSRAGWYECVYGGHKKSYGSTTFNYFDGDNWAVPDGGPRLEFGNTACNFGDEWRGLAEQPK